MIPSIARQSVIQKCTLQRSVLTGNYEFYYLAGLLHKLYGIEVNENMEPNEMLSVIGAKLDSITPGDEREAYLIKLVSVYEASDSSDAQMRLLFRWGAGEQDMWQIQTAYSPQEA